MERQTARSASAGPLSAPPPAAAACCFDRCPVLPPWLQPRGATVPSRVCHRGHQGAEGLLLQAGQLFKLALLCGGLRGRCSVARPSSPRLIIICAGQILSPAPRLHFQLPAQ